MFSMITVAKRRPASSLKMSSNRWCHNFCDGQRATLQEKALDLNPTWRPRGQVMHAISNRLEGDVNANACVYA
jgi:hypothetical protein